MGDINSDNIVTLEIDNVDQPLKCPKCTRTFSNVGHLKCHFYRVHSEFRLAACNVTAPPSSSEKCEFCEKSFPTKKDLKDHQCTDIDTIPANKCKECDKIFTKKSSLFRHCERVHVKANVCNICDKEFASKTYLTAHYRTHTKEKLYACETCNQAFASEDTLKVHCKSHDKKFVCKTCKREFGRKCYLVRHSMSHKKK